MNCAQKGKERNFSQDPNSVTLEPETFYWVDVNVTIPAYHPGSLEVQPSLFATELGKEGGATVINIQMQKIVQLRILPNPDPSLIGKSQLLTRDYPQVITIGGKQVNLLIQSASEITGFNFDQASKKISFQVSGGESTVVDISSVLNGPYAVSIDGDGSITYESSVSSDGRESIRISHDHDTHTITITGTSVVPEFALPLDHSGCGSHGSNCEPDLKTQDRNSPLNLPQHPVSPLKILQKTTNQTCTRHRHASSW